MVPPFNLPALQVFRLHHCGMGNRLLTVNLPDYAEILSKYQILRLLGVYRQRHILSSGRKVLLEEQA